MDLDFPIAVIGKLTINLKLLILKVSYYRYLYGLIFLF